MNINTYIYIYIRIIFVYKCDVRTHLQYCLAKTRPSLPGQKALNSARALRIPDSSRTQTTTWQIVGRSKREAAVMTAKRP